MKNLLIMLAFLMVSFGVSAQRKGGYYHVYRPPTRVIIAPSIGWGYPFGYWGGLYYPYGYPYYGYNSTPYRLSAQIQSIKVDYRNRIRETRHDKSMSHSQRRQEIRNLKGERAQAIADAQRDFYNNRRNRYNGNNNGNQ